MPQRTRARIRARSRGHTRRRPWPVRWLARRGPRRMVFFLATALLAFTLNNATLAELSRTVNTVLYRAGTAVWSAHHTGQYPTALGLHTYGYPTSYYGDVAQYVTAHGVGDVRYTFSWNYIQPNPHAKTFFNWGETDTNIAALPATDNILGVLGPFAISWDHGVPCGNGALCTGVTDDLGTLLGNYDEVDPADPSIAFNAWDMYVFRTVSRYGSRGNGLGPGYGQNRAHVWEVLSEIDDSVFADKGVDFSPSRLARQGHDYGAVLKRTASIIHLADPNAAIISQGMGDFDPNRLLLERTELLPRSRTFLRALAATGALDVVDGFGIHPYGAVAFHDGIQLTQYLDSVGRYVAQLAGRTIPLWVTEVGFTSDALAPGNLCVPICEAHADSAQRASETRVMFEALVELMASPYVQAIYWFQASTFYTGYAGVGFSSEVAYGLMTRHGDDPALVQSDRGQVFFDFLDKVFNQDYRVTQFTATDGDYLFSFKNQSSYLTVLWSPGIYALNTNKIAPGDFAGLTFMQYRSFPITPGHAPILLGDQPIYIVSRAPLAQVGHDLLLVTPPAPTATPTYAVPGA